MVTVRGIESEPTLYAPLIDGKLHNSAAQDIANGHNKRDALSYLHGTLEHEKHFNKLGRREQLKTILYLVEKNYSA